MVRATCEDDIRHVLAAAREHRVAVKIRGAAHTCNGQTLTEGGILVVNVADRKPDLRISGDGRVEVSGRQRWGAVEKALNKKGRSVPVLADYLPLTVGGTLSVGGYGADSVLHGPQVDLVERLRLIKPDGEAVWCSTEENAELFRFSLAGLGQVGVIEKVVLRTVPSHRWTTLFVYKHDSLRDMAESFAWMSSGEEGPRLFKACHSRGRCVSVYGVHSDTAGAALAARPPAALSDRPVHRRLVCPRYRSLRNLAVFFWVARFGHRPRVWSDYMLDFQGLRAFARHLRELEARDAFSGCLKATYVLGVRRRPEAPDFAFEAASGSRAPIQYLVGLYTMVPNRRPHVLERVQQAVGSCLEVAMALGGRPYLYGWHRFAPETIQRLYGADVDRLVELRQELDPDALFQRDKLLFA